MKEKFKANPEFVLREIAGELLLIPTGTMTQTFNGLASLNETALFLWEFLREERTRKELYAAFGKEYELTEEESFQAVEEFLKTGIEEHMIMQRLSDDIEN